MGAVELGDGAVLEVLHPLAELIDTVDGPVRVRLEELLGLLDRCSREDAGAGCAHLGFDAVEFVPPPLVGLLQVQFDAIVDARRKLVEVPANAVALDRSVHEAFF